MVVIPSLFPCHPELVHLSSRAERSGVEGSPLFVIPSGAKRSRGIPPFCHPERSRGIPPFCHPERSRGIPPFCHPERSEAESRDPRGMPRQARHDTSLSFPACSLVIPSGAEGSNQSKNLSTTKKLKNYEK